MPSLGLEDLLNSLLPLLPAESDLQPEPEVVQEPEPQPEPEPEPEAVQEPEPEPEEEVASDPGAELAAGGEQGAAEGSEAGPGSEVTPVEPDPMEVTEPQPESEAVQEPEPEPEEEVASDPGAELAAGGEQGAAEGSEAGPGSEVTPVEPDPMEVTESKGVVQAGTAEPLENGKPLPTGPQPSSRPGTKVTIPGVDRPLSTGRDDRIQGGAPVELIKARRLRDLLTGGDGPDRFGFRWGDSRIGALDRITDFTFGEDKIALLDRRGRVQSRPHRFSRAGDNRTARTLQQLAADVFADADGRLAGKQRLRQRSAVVVKATNRKIRGTYLLINDTNAGLNLRNDLIVNIRGFSGDLPAFGRIDPGVMFG